MDIERIKNKTILVGIKYVDKKGNTTEKKQYFGKIISFDLNVGLGILLNDTKEIFYLPPDLSSIKKAPKGIYKLKSKDETAVCPDYISTWTVNNEKD